MGAFPSSKNPCRNPRRITEPPEETSMNQFELSSQFHSAFGLGNVNVQRAVARLKISCHRLCKSAVSPLPLPLCIDWVDRRAYYGRVPSGEWTREGGRGFFFPPLLFAPVALLMWPLWHVGSELPESSQWGPRAVPPHSSLAELCSSSAHCTTGFCTT